MIQAVLFDIDDTLYPYAPCNEAGEAGMREALAAMTGVPLSPADFPEQLALAKRHVKACNAGTAACHSRMLYAHRLCELYGCFSAGNALRLYDAYWEAYLAQMRLFPGALEVLLALRGRGVKLGFCTDLTAHIQMRKLVALGIPAIADAVVTSEEAGAEKPDPRPFRLLLEKLGVAPEQALMVGDDYRKDILGAQALGIAAVQLGKDCAHPVHAADFAGLTAILRELLA